MIKYTLFLLFVTFSTLSAYNPVGDAYFAKKFLQRYPYQNEEQTQEFYAGTFFPGITVFDPDMMWDTRFEHVTVFEILQEKSPFVAGMKFHNFLKDAREDLLEEHGLPDSDFLQILVNEPLYHTDYFGDRASYFTKIWPEERLLEDKEEILKLWHTHLINTLADSPRYWAARARFLNDPSVPYTKQELKNWHISFPFALRNPQITAYIADYPIFMEKKLLEK